MNGYVHRILLVLIALGTILGGAFWYDSHVDDKIKKESSAAQKLVEVKLEGMDELMKSRFDDVDRRQIRMERSIDVLLSR